MAGLWIRLYGFLRRRPCPFKIIEGFVPESGRILDLGCGFGLFSVALCLGSAARKVTGIDCEEKRIRAAKELARGRSAYNCEFFPADIITCDYRGPYDCILLTDVLYQLSSEEKSAVARKCRDALSAGGSLIVKEMSDRPLWKLCLCRLQESFLARPRRLNRKRIDLPAPDELREILGCSGFETETVNIDKGYAYPHMLLICRKKE